MQRGGVPQRPLISYKEQSCDLYILAANSSGKLRVPIQAVYYYLMLSLLPF